ncbi:uncharacterized protein LOC127089011 isoform X2 [Lathyrus oleraceus]|uniref:uncharacterized protein LOC127089011 isoform X2 n=1 Tax=Pisum sativum TaxID=3888 RepID=UPI0021D18ACC|nr:uncharacterized protein LOC127089011 isoform X2 [Pisum sativum]
MTIYMQVWIGCKVVGSNDCGASVIGLACYVGPLFSSTGDWCRILAKVVLHSGLLQLFHLGMECRLMDVDGCYVLLWCKCTFIGMVVLVMQHVVLTESWLFPCLGMQCYCRMVFVQGCYGLVWHEVSLQVCYNSLNLVLDAG